MTHLALWFLGEPTTIPLCALTVGWPRRGRTRRRTRHRRRPGRRDHLRDVPRTTGRLAVTILKQLYVCADDHCKASVTLRTLGKCEVEVGHWCRGKPGRPWREMKRVDVQIGLIPQPKG